MSERDTAAQRDSLLTSLPERMPGLELSHDLELLAAKGAEIVSAISFEILDLVASSRLRDETVLINGLTRVKTNADRISTELFDEHLGHAFPGMTVLSERSRIAGTAGPGAVAKGAVHAVVDPIDGTAHLQRGDGQWIVNLAFCCDGEALVGISAVPAEGKLFLGIKGRPSIELALDGRSRRQLDRPERSGGLVLGICSLLDLGNKAELHDRWQRVAEINQASSTMEFGSAYSYLKVADGTLDAFVNLGGNFHWDTAAQQVILEGAGARLVDLDWCTTTLDVSTAKPCRYGLDFIKDDGHVAARNGLILRVDPALRMQWTPAFS